MGAPYVGEIRMFAGNRTPAGWMYCDGQSLAISEYETLFILIGTTYGGDGEETFNLPNLCGRVPIHQGQGGGLSSYQLGEAAGVENVTLSTQQIPNHSHAFVTSTSAGTGASPEGRVLATAPQHTRYLEGAGYNRTLHVQSVQPVGGSQPHENMAPYLAITFIISLFGVYPPTE